MPKTRIYFVINKIGRSMHYHDISSKEALNIFKTDYDKGLSSDNIPSLLSKYGFNELTEVKKHGIIYSFFYQFRDFTTLVLIAAAIISYVSSFLEGNPDIADTIIIISIIVINAILGVLQEYKAEKTLDALKRKAAPEASVLRDGRKLSCPVRELVPGDIIFLEAGQSIPADARLLTSVNLLTDEAALTGESHPVSKNAEASLAKDCALAERCNMVFSSSSVFAGRATAIVTATGMHTEVGRIADMLNEQLHVETPLQKKLAATSRYLAICAMAVCLALLLIGIFQGREFYSMFMIAVSLAVSAIPEGLPAIVTIMLSLGVRRMAKKNAVIRKLPAVEALGSATYICSDKTGTLTQNRMTVTVINTLSADYSVSAPEAIKILHYASLCSDTGSDPTETALINAYELSGDTKKELDSKYPRVHEIPFDSVTKVMLTIHSLGNRFLSVIKGAPECVLPLCTSYKQGTRVPALDNNLKRRILDNNSRLASEGLRILCVATCELDHAQLKLCRTKGLSAVGGMCFEGLIGITDPPRREIIPSVRECRHAGIIPVMITGDNITSAVAIARQTGILDTNDSLNNAICGSELDKLSDKVLSERIKNYRVFARVTPSHKVRIVKALQKHGEVVAMTGDGINDAPALKAADIGCAMGLTGTDVAKSASDIILTDDNFATIVAAVREGRGIYSNIKKAVHFLLSCNIGEIITIFTAIALGHKSPLLPIQLLWVNLITDSLPAIALGYEAPDPYIMRQPPAKSGKSIFSFRFTASIVLEGFMIGFLSLIACLIGKDTYGNTMAFAVLGLSQLFHAFNTRSSSSVFTVGLFSNPRLTGAFAIGSLLMFSVINIPAISGLFNTVPLSLSHWIIVAVLSFIPIPVIELQKLLLKRSNPVEKKA